MSLRKHSKWYSSGLLLKTWSGTVAIAVSLLSHMEQKIRGDYALTETWHKRLDALARANERSTRDMVRVMIEEKILDYETTPRELIKKVEIAQ